MSEFSELIKSFEKIREYMRDFYVYGFKTRGDYTAKSARTYDNERRRIESWLSKSIRWENSPKGKRVFLSVDSARVPQNPLYAAWKSKSFTKNDVMLHFFLLDLLSSGTPFSVAELTNAICERYHVVFDVQTVRGKLREYEREGVVCAQKDGRALLYTLSRRSLEALPFRAELFDAVKFFQEVAPFGFIGSTILDGWEEQNDLFFFKHHFIVHTLEDGILLDLLSAVAQRRAVCLENRSRRSGRAEVLYGVPLRVMVSVQSGRRYICLYRENLRRFLNVRLDSIVSVLPGEAAPDFDELREKLDRARKKCWGVSFGDRGRGDQLFLKLHVEERTESYVLDRLRREGRQGELLRVGPDTFLYSIEVFDPNEMLSWVKTFTGRILSLECTNPYIREKFNRDMERMYAMYCGEDV